MGLAGVAVATLAPESRPIVAGGEAHRLKVFLAQQQVRLPRSLHRIVGHRRRVADPPTGPAANEGRVPSYTCQPSGRLAKVRYRRSQSLASDSRLTAPSLEATFATKLRASGRGRVPVATNGCFVDAEPDGGRSERRTALEKPDGQQWVDCRHTRPTADRHPILLALALRNRPEATGRFR